jgi:single-stranded DNA-binding protein
MKEVFRVNKVYLTGIIADPPMGNPQENGSAHVSFPLCVSHKTKQGLVKRELYNVQAWNGVAQWARANLRQGQRVMLQGYLTQHSVKQADGSTRQVVEVTAEEFFPASLPRPATITRIDMGAAAETQDRPTEQENEAQPETAAAS